MRKSSSNSLTRETVKILGKTVVATGGAAGIGKSLCDRSHAEGALKVVAADRAFAHARAVAQTIGGEAMLCDVADEGQIIAAIDYAERNHGSIDLFCSNAGIATLDTERGNAASAPNAAWTRSWEVNVMAHVYAARALGPRVAARGGGYVLSTVSAAGILSQIDGAVCATTKHAAIGFAESLAITHRDRGIRVSVLCPQGVDTPMLRAMPGGPQMRDGVLSAEAVAACVVDGLANERFLILPYEVVADYLKRKTGDHDRWIAGMANLRKRVNAG